MTYAPVILFVYNRPWHTEQTLRALQQNDLASESELYIYADGPKPHAEEKQLQQIRQVREIIRREQWCGTVHIIESETNKGLADSVIAGVTEVVNRHGRVIVLEDDIVTSSGFLRYMNDALELYKDDTQVMHISGYIYPYKTKRKMQKQDTCFLKIYSCWGWATWQRAWMYFEPDVNIHLQHYSTPQEIKQFNVNGHMPNYWQLLANKNGDIYTWAVKWYASWLWQGGLSLFPFCSLVRNIGVTGQGEHNSPGPGTFDPFRGKVVEAVSVKRINMQEDTIIRLAVDDFYEHMFPVYLVWLNKLKKLMRKLKNKALKMIKYGTF